MSGPYPLIFEPILLAKVWGGDRLARFGKAVRAGETVGESWELADLASTSASGAGGAPQRSVITNGPLKGLTLADALQRWGSGMLGRPAPDTGFPLLLKFLDARENLSVQVHPSPAFAAAHPGAHLKTECWYILDAAPGSVIYKGVKRGVTPADFEAHIGSGRVTADLIAVPAVPGEIHNLPSGTCHALGAGVLVAEVQTPSDTTFRIYDWGRAGRELHIPQAMACIDFGPAPDALTLRSPSGGPGPVLDSGYFRVQHLALANGDDYPVSTAGACTAVMVLRGSGSLYSEEGQFSPQTLREGSSALIPAAVAQDASLAAPETGRLECLLVTIP